jgi:DNA-binding transcriptional regulator YbjK
MVGTEDKETQMIKFYTKIKKLEQKKQLKRAWKDPPGDPNSPVFEEYEDLGWAVLFEGSMEWLFIGKDDPPANFKVGTPMVVTIEVYNG